MSEVRRRPSQTPRVHELDSAQSGITTAFKPPQNYDDVFSFSFRFAFCVIGVTRVLSAFFNIMSDCDEVFNYWEPTHYMMYGFGLQTWEYSPQYALRSYAYSGLHALMGHIATLFGNSKVETFFHMRVGIGLFSALCEAYFFRAVRLRFGGIVANLTLLFLTFSPGMFLASTAYLPNTFAMHLFLIGFASWMLPHISSHERVGVSVSAISCAVLMGTPFVIAAAVPAALQLLYSHGLPKVVMWGLLSSAFWLGGSMIVDYAYYGHVTCPIFNTLMYNALGGGPGSQLYGVAPASFYLKNLVLNFNVLLPAAACVVPVVGVCFIKRSLVSANALRCGPAQTLMYVSPLFIWLAVMFKLEHKEERFLFPVYPLICLAAAVTLSLVSSLITIVMGRNRVVSSVLGVIKIVVLLAVVLLSASRITSMYKNYHAPIDIWEEVSRKVSTKGDDDASVSVCVSKEWYRFPSSFFTPDHIRVKYVRSDFTGQLPRYYEESGKGSRIVHPYFNDLNIGDQNAFVSLDECDYFVDFEPSFQKEPRLSEQKEWKVKKSVPFLESESSHPLYRAFYVPFLSEKHVKFSPYVLLKKRRSVPTQ